MVFTRPAIARGKPLNTQKLHACIYNIQSPSAFVNIAKVNNLDEHYGRNLERVSGKGILQDSYFPNQA